MTCPSSSGSVAPERRHSAPTLQGRSGSGGRRKSGLYLFKISMNAIGVIGLSRENGKENGNYRKYRDYIGVIYRDYRVYIGVILGMMEKNMETTV